MPPDKLPATLTYKDDVPSDTGDTANDLSKLISCLWIGSDQPDGCDTDSFLADLEAMDAPESEKRKLIHDIWYILETIVRVELGLDPTQNVLAKQFKQYGNPPQSMVNCTSQAEPTTKRKESS